MQIVTKPFQSCQPEKMKMSNTWSRGERRRRESQAGCPGVLPRIALSPQKYTDSKVVIQLTMITKTLEQLIQFLMLMLNLIILVLYTTSV